MLDNPRIHGIMELRGGSLSRVARERTGGYGCTCPSFRRQPSPLFVLKAFARSLDVMVSNRKEHPDGRVEWDATSGGEIYSVTYSPDAPGGFCKHIVGTQDGWIKTGCIGAKEVLTELETVKKELRRVTKERDKCQKKSMT